MGVLCSTFQQQTSGTVALLVTLGGGVALILGAGHGMLVAGVRQIMIGFLLH